MESMKKAAEVVGVPHKTLSRYHAGKNQHKNTLTWTAVSNAERSVVAFLCPLPQETVVSSESKPMVEPLPKPLWYTTDSDGSVFSIHSLGEQANDPSWAIKPQRSEKWVLFRRGMKGRKLFSTGWQGH